MAVSRPRITSLSELQLPHAFLKERPFETIGKQPRTRQETQDDSAKCSSLEYKLSKATSEKDPCNVQEKEELDENWCHLEELGHFADKFAPHIIALEQFQQKIRMFLKEIAQREVQKPAAEEMSEEEQQRNLEVFMAIFYGIILIKIKELFRLSMFHEVCLKRIQCVGSDELEPLRKAILETEGIIRTFEKVLLTDRECTLETQMNHRALNISLDESKMEVGKLFEESVFFQGQLPVEDMIRYTASESRVAFALGLEIDFLDKLKLFDNDEFTSHWSMEEWILNSLSNNYEDIDDEELKRDLSKELLIELGFRENSQAIETILERSSLSQGHVDPIELVKRFVMDELKNHPVFAQELYRFPYTDKACVQCEIDIADNMINVMHMNVSQVEDTDELYYQYISKHIDALRRDEGSVLLFHGTDHSSAIDILNRGIDINLGMRKHDFTDGYGFYLSNDYKQSETWSRSQTRKPAVLVFKVPKTFLEESNTLDLSGEGKRDEWLQIVTENRRGRPSKKLRNKMKNYDIVRGPMSKRSDDASKSHSYEPREELQQVCILTEDRAEEMQEYLNTAIFYE